MFARPFCCIFPLIQTFCSQANSTHFWLNEGWTTYIERVLLQLLHTPADRGFSFLIGSKSLQDALKQYEKKPKYQRLVIDFDVGEDPDDAYSTVPYEKGANFLLHLERMLGGLDEFLPYIHDYVSTYMGKSITTEDWKAHLYAYWEKHGGEEKIKALNSVKWDVSIRVAVHFACLRTDHLLARTGMVVRRGPQAPRRDDLRHCPRT